MSVTLNLQTFTVLIVEDLATDRELYRRILGQDSSCAYDLLEAESVAAGLALCQARSIDAILLDHRLPDGSGLDFLERLLAQRNGISPPVVMISGYDNQRIAIRAIKLGAEDYLVKCELTTELLLATLHSAIENTRLRSQLQQQKEQITTIWESMTDAYVTIDPDWRIVYTNSAATKIFFQTTGLTPADYLGKTHWDVFPTTLGTIVEQEYRRAVSDRVAVHFELFYEPTKTWFETNAYPSDVGLGIYFRDINERKQSELAQIAAEQERDRFFDVSIDLLVVINLDGYFVRVNPACEQILGFTSAEIMAQPFIDFLHPDDIAASMAVFEGLGAANVLADFENRYRCKDGSYCWILWSAILDPKRKLIYANGHDITDRKIAELNERFLSELTQRLRKLTNPEAIQWEALKGLGEYLNVDRAMWFDVDLERGMVTISRHWNRNGVGSMVGEYSIDEFASPTLQSTLRAGEPIAIADVSIDPLTAAYSDNYQQAGITAFAGIPCLDDEGRWVMTLHLNTHQNVRIWRDDEIQLMQTLVTQLWSLVAQARSVMALRAQEEKTRVAQAIAQQQLGEIEAIYQMAPVGLCFVDTDLRYVRINERLAQINGLSVAEHIGKTFREVLPEVADTIEPMYRQIIASGEPIIDLEVTGTNRAQPGVERCWLASFYPQTDDRGRVIGVNNVVLEITDRKHDEERLRQSEEFNRRILESNRDCIKVVDLAGRLVYMNDYGQSLMEINDFSTIIRSQWLDFWQDSDQELARTAFSVALAGGVSRFEGYCPTDKGTPKWWEVNVTPILAADGQVSQILSVSRDITDRKQAAAIFQVQQETIQQQFGEIETIYQTAPVGMSCGDINMRYVRINEQLAHINGLPVAAHIGRTLREVLPEIADQLEPLYRQVIESGEPILNLEISGIVPSQPGVERQWLLCYYPQKDAEERTIGVNSIVQEITEQQAALRERKQAEIALKIGEKLFRSTFENTSVGMAHVAIDGPWIRVNHKLCEILGYSSAELLATTYQAITVLADADEDVAVVERLLNGEINEWTLEKRYIHKQGHYVWADLTVTLIRTIATDGQLGIPQYFIAVIQDITDRKQAQADLEERNQELNSFVYVVSHDLKAPLRAVANLSQWIEDDLEEHLTDDTRSHMNLLRNRVDRMAGTIDGLLEYARCARREEDIELVEMAKLLEEIIDSVDPPTPFTIDLPAELPTFFTKRIPLFQVLFNLVNNGVQHHHSEAGSIQISIEDHGDFYEFAIADNGPGIAPEHQEKMFKIFQAVNPQNRSDSTGIGLAIVKKTIEAEGGRIWLESELGRGTTFYFTWFQR